MKEKIGMIATAVMCVGFAACATDRSMTTATEREQITQGRSGYTYRAAHDPAHRLDATPDMQQPRTIGLYVGDESNSRHLSRVGGRGHVGLQVTHR